MGTCHGPSGLVTREREGECAAPTPAPAQAPRRGASDLFVVQLPFERADSSRRMYGARPFEKRTSNAGSAPSSVAQFP